MVISLGNPDGSVDQWALNTADSRRLLHHLAIALRFDERQCGPANEPEVVKRFAVPHSILRAELDVDNLPTSLQRLKLEMEEVGEYVEDHLTSLRRSLTKCGLAAKSTDRIMKRVMRFVLIAVDAARIDK